METVMKKMIDVAGLRRVAERVPTAAAALALGIASLGLALDTVLQLNGFGQMAGAAFAIALQAFVATKFVLCPGLLVREMAHPVLAGGIPTFAMGLMVVSRAVGVYFTAAGEVLWLTAVAIHLFFLAAFVVVHVRPHAIKNMVPSWFIPPVGIITAALTLPCAAFAGMGRGLLIFGAINLCVLLPAMIYRFIFHPEIADQAKPTIAIMAAPVSLCLAGYLSITQVPSPILTTLLLGVALLMTAIGYLALTRLLRLPFSPAFAAFTFPMVISPTALLKASSAFAAHPVTADYAVVLHHMALTELAIAVLLVGYVSWLYAAAASRALLPAREQIAVHSTKGQSRADIDPEL